MYVFRGTISGARAAMQESLDGFIDGCIAEFERTRAWEPSEPEEASWRNSWPELLGALTQAGLGRSYLFLEYEFPGTGQRQVERVKFLRYAEARGDYEQVVAMLNATAPHGS